MTDDEFLKKTHERLAVLAKEQRSLHERMATELRRMYGLRTGLGVLTGSLALGLGLSVGYQLGRR